MPRVLIVDDHAFIRRGVQAILERFPEWELCGEADNGQDAVRLAKELRPDVVVMDVSMPGMNGIDATRAISAAYPEIRIVLLTLHQSDELFRNGFNAGARGYLMKSDAEQELVKALRILVGNGTYVSPNIDQNVVSSVLSSLTK